MIERIKFPFSKRMYRLEKNIASSYRVGEAIILQFQIIKIMFGLKGNRLRQQRNFIHDNINNDETSWARTLWARSKFGLWYAAVGVVKMLHTDNKQQIRKLIQSPSKRRSYVTPGGLYHRPNLERAHKILLCLFILMWLHRNGVITII